MALSLASGLVGIDLYKYTVTVERITHAVAMNKYILLVFLVTNKESEKPLSIAAENSGGNARILIGRHISVLFRQKYLPVIHKLVQNTDKLINILCRHVKHRNKLFKLERNIKIRIHIC